jgi:hypothetical protein
MKRFTIALMLALGVSAHAQASEPTPNQLSITGARYHLSNTDSDQNRLKVRVSTSIGANTLDVGSQYSRTLHSGASSNELEMGYTVRMSVLGAEPFVRFGVGKSWSNTLDFGYWTVEPGIALAVNSQTLATASWEHRDAFDNLVNRQENRYKLGARVQMNKSLALGAQFVHATGSQGLTSNGVEFTLMRGF